MEIDSSEIPVLVKREYYSFKKEDFTSSSDSSEEGLDNKKNQSNNWLSHSARYTHKLVKFVKSGSVWKPISSPRNTAHLLNNLQDSETMTKILVGKKRKRDTSSSEKEVDIPIKKEKLEENIKHLENNVRPKSKAAKRSAHNVSSSEDESIFETPSVDKAFKSQKSPRQIKVEIQSQESESPTNNSYYMEESPLSNKKTKSKRNLENTMSAEYQSNIEVFEEPSLTKDDEDEVIQLSSLFSEDFISKNNIWTLQCPETMNCSELTGQNLSFSDNGSSKLNINGSVFEVHSYRNELPRPATVAVPSYSNNLRLYNVPIIGNLIIEETERVNKSSRNPIVEEQPDTVELPQNLRVRHPLFGLNYEKQCKTLTSFKKHKKKKKSRLSETTINGTTDLIEETSDNLERKKHKRKRRKNSDSD